MTSHNKQNWNRSHKERGWNAANHYLWRDDDFITMGEISSKGYRKVFNNNYHSLAKKGQWAEHLTNLPKRGVGALSTVSAFNHERPPTSCLQRLEALEANNWTQNNVQRNHQQFWSRVLTAHNTLNCTMWRWAYCSSRLVSRLPCSPH